MEKVIYLLWKPEKFSNDEFRQHLLNQAKDELLSAGGATPLIKQLRVNVVDSAVDDAAAYRIEASKPPFAAMVAVWLDSARNSPAIENIIKNTTNSYAGYVVSESEPLTQATESTEEGDRSRGMNQIVLLQQPPRLTREEWLDTWLNSHTDIAIETQSTFGYRQNIVTRPLTSTVADVLGIQVDAIVEENFPEAAISDRRAFYDAIDDNEKFEQNQQTMIDSIMRFIDFDKLDCIPTSEYIIKK